MEEYFCPHCNEELKKWDATVYECPGCGNMFDGEVLEEA